MASGPSPIIMTNPQVGDVYIYSVSAGRAINTTLGGAGIASLSALNTLSTTVSTLSTDVTTNYATKTYVDTAISVIDLTPFVTKASNLSDLGNIVTARTNLGLGTAAVQSTAFFALASHTHAQSDITGLVSALAGKLASSVVSAYGLTLIDDADASVARTTLGLGTAAIQNTGAFAAASHSHAQSDVINLVSDLAAKASLISPALSGTPTAPTATAGTNTTQIASTAFVQGAVSDLVAGSPSALNTLNELAAALGNDANFSTTIATTIGLKAPLASPVLTGTPIAPTATAGTNTTQLATTAFVTTAASTVTSNAVAKSGDTMTGALNMGAQLVIFSDVSIKRTAAGELSVRDTAGTAAADLTAANAKFLKVYSQTATVTNTSTDGIIAENLGTTNAGVTTRLSPRLRLTGVAYASTPATSQTHDWIEEVVPTTGTTTTTSKLRFGVSVAGGSVVYPFTLNSDGSIAAGPATFSGQTNVGGSGGNAYFDANGDLRVRATKTWTLYNANDFAVMSCTAAGVPTFPSGVVIPTVTTSGLQMQGTAGIYGYVFAPLPIRAYTGYPLVLWGSATTETGEIVEVQRPLVGTDASSTQRRRVGARTYSFSVTTDATRRGRIVETISNFNGDYNWLQVDIDSANVPTATFTGPVTHPTPPAGDNSTKSATTGFVQYAVSQPRMVVTNTDRASDTYDYYGGTLASGSWKVNRWDRTLGTKTSATQTNNSGVATLAAAWTGRTGLVYA